MQKLHATHRLPHTACRTPHTACRLCEPLSHTPIFPVVNNQTFLILLLLINIIFVS